MYQMRALHGSRHPQLFRRREWNKHILNINCPIICDHQAAYCEDPQRMNIAFSKPMIYRHITNTYPHGTTISCSGAFNTDQSLQRPKSMKETFNINTRIGLISTSNYTLLMRHTFTAYDIHACSGSQWARVISKSNRTMSLGV